jgi:hypothetical protein
MEEPDYWRKRLASQMHYAQLGASLGVGEGNYKAFVNSVEAPILENSKNRMLPFDIGNVNNIAVTALSHVDGVNTLLLQNVEQN